MSKPSPLDLTQTQLEIMNLIWEHGACSITFLWQALSARRTVARNTVLTLVQRLLERGFLLRSAAGRGHVYKSRVPRETAQVGRLRQLIDQVYAGSAEALVRLMLGNGMIEPDQIQRLRELLDEPGKPAGRTAPPRRGRNRS